MSRSRSATMSAKAGGSCRWRARPGGSARAGRRTDRDGALAKRHQLHARRQARRGRSWRASIVYGRRDSIGGPGRCEIPASVDYNLWAGPAPMVPPSRPKFHYDWHWFWDTGNGELGNNNIHSLDICRWGLDVNGLGRAVLSYGGRLGYRDAGQTPNTQVVVFDFGDKTIVAETRAEDRAVPSRLQRRLDLLRHRGHHRGHLALRPEGQVGPHLRGQERDHFANFLKAVRSRKVTDLNADILEGHQSTALCHIGNISYRLGAPAAPEAIERQLDQLKVHDRVRETFERTRKHLAENHVDLEKSPLTLGSLLRIDPEREAFLDNERANALLTREYRRPFVVPAEGEV